MELFVVQARAVVASVLAPSVGFRFTYVKSPTSHACYHASIVSEEATIKLKGKRILVVEDDYFLAAQLCDELRRAGATVLGPAPTPFYAMQLLGRRGADSAVLDIKLHGTTVFGLADELVRQGTPIVFATGYGDDVFPERFRGRPRVTKPYLDQQLIDLLVELDADRNYVEPVDAADSSEPANAAPPDSSHARIVRVVAAVIRRNAIAARDA